MQRFLQQCLVAIFLLFSLIISAQSTADIQVKRTSEDITLDGELTEKAWFTSVPAKHFWQYFPTDSAQAKGQTEIYMVYDDEFLYVGVKCYTKEGEYITPSLRRDFSMRGNDNISLVFDTYSDNNNAFMFGMNAHGVRREALISGGGRRSNDFGVSWDNKWYGESKMYEDYWVAEMAIPFKTFRYNEGVKRWGFNCYRNDTKHNEISSWNRIPQNQIVMDLGFMGNMIWDEPLKKPGTNISVIPYAIASSVRDFEDETQTGTDYSGNAGFDAKIGVTSALNLDLTVNPDFSQVEVDRQVTNLDRFEIFFPERRQFFLENADLFGGFGFSRLNPFFSRRIGVAIDTATGQNIQNPILYGARLSGKLNNRLRVGLLNMQTAAEEENGLPSFNYTVAAVQQEILSRSNLAFVFVNKQAINGDPNSDLYSMFNRVAGAEYRIFSKDNRLSGKIFYHQSFTPTNEDHQYSSGMFLNYITRNYRLEFANMLVGNDYNPAVGFAPRKDFWFYSPEVEFFFYPQKGKINRHSIQLDYEPLYSLGQRDSDVLDGFGLADSRYQLSWRVNFKSNARLNMDLQMDEVLLFNDFDPTRIQADSVFLAAGTEYRFTSFRFQFNSDSRKKFFYRITPTVGQFYNGFRAGVNGEFTYRYQPYGFVSLNYTYNYIDLEASFEKANL